MGRKVARRKTDANSAGRAWFRHRALTPSRQVAPLASFRQLNFYNERKRGLKSNHFRKADLHEYPVPLKTTVPIMLRANCLLLVNGCIMNRNIAPLRFTMRLFTGNLRKQKSRKQKSRSNSHLQKATGFKR